MQTRTIDLVVSLLFMSVAAIVMYDSQRLGAGWGFDGPETGYFPFYLALIMFASSGVTLVRTLAGGVRAAFVDAVAFRRVLMVLVPAAIYFVAIPYTGLYAAAAVFIGYFMVAIGRYRLIPSVLVAALVPLAAFMLFEIWFLVPLPKGPIEHALGY